MSRILTDGLFEMQTTLVQCETNANYIEITRITKNVILSNKNNKFLQTLINYSRACTIYELVHVLHFEVLAMKAK